MTYSGNVKRDAPTPSTAASTPSPAWPVKKDAGSKAKPSRPEDERPGSGPPGPSGARPSNLPRRPHTTHSQTRPLGDSGSMSKSSNLGSTMGSTLASTRSDGKLKSSTTKQGTKDLQGIANMTNEARQTIVQGEGGVVTKGPRIAHLLTMDSSAMVKQLKKVSKSHSKKEASNAARAAIDAKCSPEVQSAFRSQPQERCGCASIQAVWSACDTFWEFDTAHSGAITREAYINLMRECATVNTLRMLRRARLELRFRRSAAPVLLEDFLLMIWPKATVEDRTRMMRWAELRECFDIVQHNFGATDQDLDRLFRLLSFRSNGGQVQVVASELGRARLLPREVIVTFARERHPKEVCFNYEDFKSIVWPKLKERWMSSDTIRKQKTLMEEKDTLRVRIQRQTEADHAG